MPDLAGGPAGFFGGSATEENQEEGERSEAHFRFQSGRGRGGARHVLECSARRPAGFRTKSSPFRDPAEAGCQSEHPPSGGIQAPTGPIRLPRSLESPILSGSLDPVAEEEVAFEVPPSSPCSRGFPMLTNRQFRLVGGLGCSLAFASCGDGTDPASDSGSTSSTAPTLSRRC